VLLLETDSLCSVGSRYDFVVPLVPSLRAKCETIRAALEGSDAPKVKGSAPMALAASCWFIRAQHWWSLRQGSWQQLGTSWGPTRSASTLSRALLPSLAWL
jgi:hypothetical protein